MPATTFISSVKNHLESNKDQKRCTDLIAGQAARFAAHNLSQVEPDDKVEDSPGPGADTGSSLDNTAPTFMANYTKMGNKDKDKKKDDFKKPERIPFPCFLPQCEELSRRFKVKCEGLKFNSLHFCRPGKVGLDIGW